MLRSRNGIVLLTVLLTIFIFLPGLPKALVYAVQNMQVTGPVTIEPSGTSWFLRPENYQYLWFATYGPSLLSGQFKSDGGVTVFVATASEFSGFESSGSIGSHTCLVGQDVVSGGFPCELQAGDWYVIFLNDQSADVQVSLTSDLAEYPVYLASESPYVLIGNGTNWTLGSGQYVYQEFSPTASFFVLGSFTASNEAVAYILDPKEYSTFAANDTVSSYHCTTGIVSEGYVDCWLGAGNWYLVIQNPSELAGAQSSVVDVTGDIMLTFLASGTSNLASYDEQMGLTFADNFTSLAYEVMAIPQADADGLGPDYLLNGLSNTGYWYQVGLAYNWETETGTSYTQGFQATYEVFSPSGISVFPVAGGGGSLALSGPIYQNDRVLLGMFFSEGDVVLSVDDATTGAYSSKSFSAYGASIFVGNPVSSSDNNGFFTGLMTEWYHEAPYYQNELVETFSPHGSVNSPAWLWADEYFCLNTSCDKDARISLFNNVTDYEVNGPYSFATDGATIQYLQDGTFLTGGAPTIPIIGFGTGSIQFLVGSSASQTNFATESSLRISTPLGTFSASELLPIAGVVVLAIIIIIGRRRQDK